MSLFVNFGPRRVRLLVAYRPPSSSLALFSTEFESLLEVLSALPERVVIVGDFNLHVDVPNDKPAAGFISKVEAFGYSQLVSGPTHSKRKKTTDRGHTLDLVLARKVDDFVYDVSVGDFVSDHRLVTCLLRARSPSWPVSTVQVRSLKSINMESFMADIQDLPLIQSPADSLEGLVQQYDHGLRSVLDKHAPLRSKTVILRPTVPWWCSEIKDAKKAVRKAERVWRKKGLAVFYETYISLLTDFTTLLRRVKADFYKGKVAELKGDSRALHQLIDGSLGTRKQPTLPNQPAQTLCSGFSEYFTSKVSGIRSALDAASDMLNQNQLVCESSPSTPTLHLKSIRRNKVLKSRRLFSTSTGGGLLREFQLLSTDDVIKMVKASSAASCQLDPIPTFLLKKCVHLLASPLARIINLSLSTGRFPSTLKHALVRPLLKKPTLDKEEKSNYRPVSNIPFLSKLIERAVAWQLMEQVDDVLSERQSAYRSNFSTETALLCLYDDLLRSADNGGATALLFLDLSAAFDTVDHGLLLDRLKDSGVEGFALEWLDSYLSGRTQSVVIGDHSSDPEALLCGVPQGSVLGPLLFLIYVAALPAETMVDGIVVDQFSDDTTARATFFVHRATRSSSSPSLTPPKHLGRRRRSSAHSRRSRRSRRRSQWRNRRRRSASTFASQADAATALSVWAACADEWFTTNRVKCNMGKSVLMFTSSPESAPHLMQTDLQIGSTSLLPALNCRHLGVTIDAQLTMASFVQAVCKSAFYHLWRIGRIRRSLDRASAECLVQSLVISRLQYANSLLFGLSKKLLDRLQAVQNAAARLICGGDRRDSARPLLRQLKWLPIREQIEMKISIMVFRCLHGSAPSYLSDRLVEHSITRPGLRQRPGSARKLVEPKALHVRSGQRSFSVAAPKIWNSLPDDVKTSSTLSYFKSSLRKYLLSRVFNM